MIQTLLYKLCGWLAYGVQKAVERGRYLMYEREGYLKSEYTKNTGWFAS